MFQNCLKKIYQSSIKLEKAIPLYLQSSSLSTSLQLKNHTDLPYGSVEFPEGNKDHEVSTAEWQYVERLLPSKFIPPINCEKGKVFPSGWTSPSATKDHYPYFAKRNPSHMLRVHVHTHTRTQLTLTHIRGLEGDLFALSRELKEYLMERTKKKLLNIKVFEPNGKILIKGDFAHGVKDFLVEKGF